MNSPSMTSFAPISPFLPGDDDVIESAPVCSVTDAARTRNASIATTSDVTAQCDVSAYMDATCLSDAGNSTTSLLHVHSGNNPGPWRMSASCERCLSHGCTVFPRCTAHDTSATSMYRVYSASDPRMVSGPSVTDPYMTRRRSDCYYVNHSRVNQRHCAAETHNQRPCVAETHNQRQCVAETHNQRQCVAETHNQRQCVAETHNQRQCVAEMHNQRQCVAETHGNPDYGPRALRNCALTSPCMARATDNSMPNRLHRCAYTDPQMTSQCPCCGLGLRRAAPACTCIQEIEHSQQSETYVKVPCKSQTDVTSTCTCDVDMTSHSAAVLAKEQSRSSDSQIVYLMPKNKRPVKQKRNDKHIHHENRQVFLLIFNLMLTFTALLMLLWGKHLININIGGKSGRRCVQNCTYLARRFSSGWEARSEMLTSLGRGFSINSKCCNAGQEKLVSQIISMAVDNMIQTEKQRLSAIGLPVGHVVSKERTQITESQGRQLSEMPWNIKNHMTLLENGIKFTDGGLVVPHTGYYHAYSQVHHQVACHAHRVSAVAQTQAMYRATMRWWMSVPTFKNSKIAETSTTRCGQYSSYISTSVYLRAGDRVIVNISGTFNSNPASTYFGIFMIQR